MSNLVFVHRGQKAETSFLQIANSEQSQKNNCWRGDTIGSGVMKTKVNAAVLIFCATLGAITVEPSGTLFENDQVRVIRAYEKPHLKGKSHEHAQTAY